LAEHFKAIVTRQPGLAQCFHAYFRDSSRRSISQPSQKNFLSLSNIRIRNGSLNAKFSILKQKAEKLL
jgi:hypothetical protein